MPSQDPMANEQSISTTFQAQKLTALKWRESNYKVRSEKLKKLKKWIMGNKKLIQEAIYQDFKKPKTETDLSEVFPIIAEINHTVKNIERWMQPQKVSTPLLMLGTSGKILYEPKGVSLIISPWNYPFNLAIGPLVSALAAGCPVTIKPSELTPYTALLLEQMIDELFPPDEVAVFRGGVEIAQQLLELPFDHIFFTGSPHVGKLVMEAAAKNLTSVTLELGGKSPLIVASDTDLTDAAEKIIKGKFLNAGQTCIAPDYIFAHHEVKDRLILEMKSAIQRMYDPNYDGIENSPDMARIINEKNFDRLTSLLDDAKAKGAKIEFGGASNQASSYLEPTMLTNIQDGMQVMEEEIFGPILPILEYSDLENVIAYINGKPKPLALYYFGNVTEEVSTILQKTSSGNVVINDCVIHFIHPNLPFGGVNTSGMGAAHGYFGFLAFSHQKGTLIQRTGINNASLLKPPYTKTIQKLIDRLIRWL